MHHWADGGETSLSNLVLVCSAHHALIHEGGFSVRRRRDGTCYFARPDGRPVELPSAEGEGGEVSSSAEGWVEVREMRARYVVGLPGRT